MLTEPAPGATVTLVKAGTTAKSRSAVECHRNPDEECIHCP